MNTENPAVRNRLTQVRLVIGAMAMGVVSFAVVVFLVGRTMPGNPSLGWTLLGALGLLGAGELGAYPLIRAGIVKSAKARYEQGPTGDEGVAGVVQSFSTATLIRAAMAEGFGLAGLAFLLVTGLTVLWFAPLISLAFLVTTLPTDERMSRFVGDVTGTSPYAR
jgi:hypothetical protein